MHISQLLLIVDMQVGLYSLARDVDHVNYRNNMLAHAALGKLFNLTTVLTTSAQTGTNTILSDVYFVIWVSD
jgi:hypothetical protein